ncbi:hypothetical protein [Actinophytocola sp.]|uniref:hypothetical protein n=1 Tax=Actinophytocola sp. TaxID=1872138 RepID=UPI002ED37E1D
MELLLLTVMVIAGLVTNGKVSSAAYENGKEPPRVAKARMRHEAGGGAKSHKGRPKGKGAFRLMAAKRWENACRYAMAKGDEKAKRRAAGLNMTAPLRDRKWFDKKLARLDKADRQRLKWGIENGLIDPPPGYEPFGEAPEARPIPPGGCLWQRPEDWGVACGADRVEGSAYCADHQTVGRTVMCLWDGGGHCGYPRPPHLPYCNAHLGEWRERAWEVNKRIVEAAAQATPEAKPEPERPKPGGEDWRNPDTELADDKPADEKPAGDKTDGDGAESKDGDASEPATPSPTEPVAGEASDRPTGGTSNMYQEAVAKLLATADRFEAYANDLGVFADSLAGKGWGQAEITGPLMDLVPGLTQRAGELRDLAAQMQQQGNSGQGAREEAPYVPEVQHLS